jgi:ketosteroid isomerase-like protein
MKALILSAFAVLLTAALTIAPGRADGPAQKAKSWMINNRSGAGASSEIIAATERWNRAILARDREALARVMADDFTLTGDDLREALPREAWLANLMNMTVTAYEARVVDVRTYGKIAIAELQGRWDVTLNGRRLAEPFSLVDFWVYRDGRWQVFRRYRVS